MRRSTYSIGKSIDRVTLFVPSLIVRPTLSRNRQRFSATVCFQAAHASSMVRFERGLARGVLAAEVLGFATPVSYVALAVNTLDGEVGHSHHASAPSPPATPS